jgi:hypothetical protein
MAQTLSCRTGFDSRPLDVEYVVDNVMVVRVSLPVRPFPSISIIPQLRLTHISFM